LRAAAFAFGKSLISDRVETFMFDTLSYSGPVKIGPPFLENGGEGGIRTLLS
jgi:hypothetical protein